MIRKIVQRGDQILRKKTEPIVDFSEVQTTIQDLIDTVEECKATYDFKRGVGLAAPQIGKAERIAIAEYDGRRYVLVNPRIVHHSERREPIREGCLSFFHVRGDVPRFPHIRVQAQDAQGREYTIDAQGDFASLLQHEIDHLDGILYVDRLPDGEANFYEP